MNDHQPIRATVVGNQLIGEHTEYKVELKAGQTTLSSVKRRFREFSELHAKLINSKHPFEVPPMPPKKFFGKTNPEFVLKRQTDLQAFLDVLVERIVAQPTKAQAAWRLLCYFLALDPKQYVPESILHDGTPPLNVGDDEFSSHSVLVEAQADSETQQLDIEEVKRMEKIVEHFAARAINISRVSEERLQAMPARYLSDTLDVSQLTNDINSQLLHFDFDAIETNTNVSSYPRISGAEDLVVGFESTGITSS